jgi:hypothetical protein
MPATDEPENTPPWASGVSKKPPSRLRRRKLVKGYCINSEEERSSESDFFLGEGEIEETKASDSWETSIPSYEYPITPPDLDTPEIRAYTHVPSAASIIFPSWLRLTDNVSITSGASSASSTFDTLTYHRELCEAQMDSDFDWILARLLSEWYYTGASVSWPGHFTFRDLLLTGLPFILAPLHYRVSISAVWFVLLRDLITMAPRSHSVNTNVFCFSSGDLSSVDSFAKSSLIISTVAAAIGLFVDVWFIFAYSGADGRKFQVSSHTLLPNCESTRY